MGGLERHWNAFEYYLWTDVLALCSCSLVVLEDGKRTSTLLDKGTVAPPSLDSTSEGAFGTKKQMVRIGAMHGWERTFHESV